MASPLLMSALAAALPASVRAVLSGRVVEIAAITLVAVTAPTVLELGLVTLAALGAGRFRSASRLPGAVAAGSATPLTRLTVVVPAHNEEALLGRCVFSLRQDLPAHGRVLVIAHNSNDGTAQVARTAGADVLVLKDAGREGKGAALRAGFERAIADGAEVLAVVDADSIVRPGFSAAVLDAVHSGAEAFQARYVVRGSGPRSRLTALGFLGFNVVRPRGRSQLGLSSGIFGNGFGMRADVLARVPYAASSVVEDLEYHLRLVEQGVRVEFLEAATVASELPTRGDAARSQRARWEGGRLRMVQVWMPRLLGRLLRTGSPRLIEPALELGTLPLATAVPLLALALFLPLGWAANYALLGFAILSLHVGLAAAEGQSGWEVVRTLAAVPGYILWKLLLVPRTLLSARTDASWVRTEREAVTLPFPAPVESLPAARAVNEGPRGPRPLPPVAKVRS